MLFSFIKLKKNLGLITLIIALILSIESFGQNFMVSPSTGKIYSTGKFIIEKNETYEYDVDFNKKGEIFKTNFIVTFQLNSEGKGTMIMSNNGDKAYLKVLSCYQKSYRNSDEKYWEFKCTNNLGQTEYAYMNRNKKSIGEFWIPIGNNKRVYFRDGWEGLFND